MLAATCACKRNLFNVIKNIKPCLENKTSPIAGFSDEDWVCTLTAIRNGYEKTFLI